MRISRRLKAKVANFKQVLSLIGAVLTLAYFMEISTRVLMEEANQESKFRLRRQAAYEEQELPEG